MFVVQTLLLQKFLKKKKKSLQVGLKILIDCVAGRPFQKERTGTCRNGSRDSRLVRVTKGIRKAYVCSSVSDVFAWNITVSGLWRLIYHFGDVSAPLYLKRHSSLCRGVMGIRFGRGVCSVAAHFRSGCEKSRDLTIQILRTVQFIWHPIDSVN